MVTIGASIPGDPRSLLKPFEPTYRALDRSVERRPEPEEIERAYEAARRAGLWRSDERRAARANRTRPPGDATVIDPLEELINRLGGPVQRAGSPEWPEGPVPDTTTIGGGQAGTEQPAPGLGLMAGGDLTPPQGLL